MRLGLRMGLNSRQGGGGDLPSLDLAFALDRSFTTDPAAAGAALITSRRGPTAKFSRGMGATQVNAAGLIEWAPENLMTRSEEFNDASWTKSQVTVNENTTTSPSGIVDADKVVESTATSIHRIVKGSLSAIAGTVYSVSVYAKADGRRYLYLNAGGFGSNSTFDLESGVVSATQNGTASITNAGNGWWRCVTTGTAATTQTTVVNFQLNTTSTASDSSYTGDGTSGIYLWGAQLERASTARTYYPTTTAAFYGPRFDYDPATGASKGLLIEESRTNLLSRSEELGTSPWGVSGGIVITPNNAISPDGLQTADTIAFTASGNLAQTASMGSAGVVATFSIFVKAATSNGFARIIIADNTTVPTNFFGGWFNTLTGLWATTNTLGSGVVITSLVTNLNNGWYRISITGSMAGISNYSPFMYITDSDNSTIRSTSVSQHWWGAQLEAGAFATSYIPTTSGTAARSADVCSIIGDDFSSFYNRLACTVDASFIPATIALPTSVCGTNDPRDLEVQMIGGGNIVGLNTNSAGSTTQLSRNPVAVGVRQNFAFASESNNQAVCLNGGTVLASPTWVKNTGVATIFHIGRAGFGGQYSGHIDRIMVFRKRLSNAKLQTLTAP